MRTLLTALTALMLFATPVVAGLVSFFPFSAKAKELRCTPTKKFVCDKESGCREIPAKVHALVDLERRTYARCDSLGCDKYDAQISKSGVFLIIELPGKGLIAKISTINEDYLEVATMHTTANTSFGSCR